MSKEPLWHPATWPFPSMERKTVKCELGRRARTLISRDGEYVRDDQGDIVCQRVYLNELRLRLYLWWKPRRIEVFTDGHQVLLFDASGLCSVAPNEVIKKALDILSRHMVLGDLADV